MLGPPLALGKVKLVLGKVEMKYLVKCSVCGATCWVRGWEESDVNAGGICDDETFDDGCDHMKSDSDVCLILDSDCGSEDDYGS